jgi:hypothetical protein
MKYAIEIDKGIMEIVNSQSKFHSKRAVAFTLENGLESK